MSFDYDRLRELLNEAPPGPWEVDEFEEQYADCPPVTKFYLGSDDMQNIAVAEATERYYDQAGRNFALLALVPDMARELLRLRDGVKALVVEKRMWVDQLCDPYEEVLNPDWLAEVGGEEPIGLALEKVCRQLTDLLEGDTE